MTNHLDRSLTYLFVDGSCLSDASAAWAVYRVEFSGDHAYFLQQASGYMGHSTSLVAEIVAAIQALRWCKPGKSYCLVSDNQAVVNALKAVKVTAQNGSELHQYWFKRLRQELLACHDLGIKVQVRWIKAHQCLSALPPKPTQEDVLRWGNHHADQLAVYTARAAGFARELDELLLGEAPEPQEALA